MNKADILRAASVYGQRFAAWIDFIVDEEASWRNGMVIPEDDHDGQGITFCGLTAASDGLDFTNLSPSWVAGSYYSGKIAYWKGVAGLPSPLLECVANWRVNMGVTDAGKILQSALNGRGASLAVDGMVGIGTITAANADADTRALCRACCTAADAHYRAIVARIPDRAYALNDWLRRDQHLLARFVDPTETPEDAMGPLSSKAMPRVPAPRTLVQILGDLKVNPQVLT